MLPKDPSKVEEYKRKLSLAQTGRKYPESTRLKLSLVHKGKLKSEETRRKMSAALTVRWSDPEERRKFGEAQRLRYQERPEYRKKVGDSHRGEKSPLFGKHLPEETKRKLRIANGGNNAYQWKGGISFEPYCPKFNDEFKERVRAFFGRRCMMPGCGYVWQLGEKKLDVHHVNFNKKTCCDNSVPLFVTLCQQCHGKTQTKREYWREFFTQIINEQFGGQCYLHLKGVA
jgi:hypothetical protein